MSGVHVTLIRRETMTTLSRLESGDTIRDDEKLTSLWLTRLIAQEAEIYD